jgi:hypothetical protein
MSMVSLRRYKAKKEMKKGGGGGLASSRRFPWLHDVLGGVSRVQVYYSVRFYCLVLSLYNTLL